MSRLQQTNDVPQQRPDRWDPNPKNWTDKSSVSVEMLENYSIRIFAKHYWASLFYVVPSSKECGGAIDLEIMSPALMQRKPENLRKKEKKNLWRNVIILLRILPLQFLLVLPLQVYISFIFLSLFRSRGRPIEHGTLITNSIESLNVSFLSMHTDKSSEQVVLTSTSA